MSRRRFKTLDDARHAYFEEKITKEEFAYYLEKFSIVDEERKEISKNAKKIERKLLAAN